MNSDVRPYSSANDRLEHAGEADGTGTPLLFVGIFCAYLALRCLAWKNTVLLEDTDSLSYLSTIKVFLTFSVQKIIDLDPDSSLFYPFFGALFTLPGWSVETGARLCSLFFGSVLFVAVLGIGKRMAGALEVALGLLIVSFSPVLISLSFAVLTEPSYVATIYLGFWFFWSQYKSPRLWKAGLLGVIFGLSFLNRMEGLLQIGIVPFLQGIHALWEGRKSYGFRRFVGWSLVFASSFSLVAIPQIWRVSHQMGTFAINGRQVWSLVLENPDGKSKNEKLFGLDFSPSQINIEYLKSHPEAVDQFESSQTGRSLYAKAQSLISHFSIDLYQEKLGVLVGPLGVVYFAFGILALCKSGRRFEAFLVLVFIGFNLVAPLLTVVRTRYVAIVAPIMMLMEGVGVVHLSHILLDDHKDCLLDERILSLVLVLVLIGVSAYPLVRTGGTFRPPLYNEEYGPAELKEPLAIVEKISGEELLRGPVISAQRGYLAYFAEGKNLFVPYTNYEGLVKFCDLNNVDFVYLKHRRVEGYPFFESFLEEPSPPDFVLLYRGEDAYGERIELYRFRN